MKIEKNDVKGYLEWGRKYGFLDAGVYFGNNMAEDVIEGKPVHVKDVKDFNKLISGEKYDGLIDEDSATFAGEGYYDYHEWGEPFIDRIDKIVEWYQEETAGRSPLELL